MNMGNKYITCWCYFFLFKKKQITSVLYNNNEKRMQSLVYFIYFVGWIYIYIYMEFRQMSQIGIVWLSVYLIKITYVTCSEIVCVTNRRHWRWIRSKKNEIGFLFFFTVMIGGFTLYYKYWKMVISVNDE